MFEAFVGALLAWHRRTSHAVTAALSQGFVVTVLVLAERAGIQVEWQPAGFAETGRLTSGASHPTDPHEPDTIRLRRSPPSCWLRTAT
ncbi:DUF6086 family protein (plasmid) [Streptomyces sp. HUAS TT3]|uniref:DUF6086 family protein n=1 Tax=Streptomyces sp. HUAS TT3 TaxID=3447510 RepID=UPI003F659319